MTSDAVKDRIIIMLSDPDRMDLEWMLPFIDELSSEQVNLEIFDFSAPMPLDRSNYWLQALRLIGHEPKLSADLEPIPRFLARAFERLRSSNVYFISVLGACYYSPKSPLNLLFPFTKWRRGKRRARLMEMVNSASCVFVEHLWKDYPPTSFEGEVLNMARECGVSIIGYPAIVDHIRPRPRRMRCEYALANTPVQAKTLKVHPDTRSVHVTPPKFTSRWLSRIIELHEQLANPAPLPPGRERVLVILKTEKAKSWKGLSFHDTTRGLMNSLLAEGAFLVLKPHPRQSQATLDRLVEGLSMDDYCIAHGPLLYWSQRVDRVVSLFSGGTLDVLAVGKVPILYWPLTEGYKKQIRLGNVPGDLMNLDEHGNLVTRYTDFCHQVTKPEYDPPESLDDDAPMERFRTLYPMAPDCREIRALIPMIAIKDPLPSETASSLEST